MPALPPGALGPGPTRVLLALLGGDRTIRAIGLRLGLRSPSTVARHLNTLAAHGLIGGQPSAQKRWVAGTLTPLVRRIA